MRLRLAADSGQEKARKIIFPQRSGRRPECRDFRKRLQVVGRKGFMPVRSRTPGLSTTYGNSLFVRILGESAAEHPRFHAANEASRGRRSVDRFFTHPPHSRRVQPVAVAKVFFGLSHLPAPSRIRRPAAQIRVRCVHVFQKLRHSISIGMVRDGSQTNVARQATGWADGVVTGHESPPGGRCRRRPDGPVSDPGPKSFLILVIGDEDLPK